MGDAAAGGNDELGGMAEEAVRGRAAPARIGGREMHADIAGADCAEYRVGEGVETDIGVGMSDQTVAVRHRDAAQPELVAGPEGVDVEALTGADVAAPRGEQPFGAREIVRRRHLEIILAALDQRYAHSGAFGDGRIVGQLGTRSRATP